MKRSLWVAAIAVSLVTVVTVAAEEPPHLEFARALRARQLPDYAIAYLEKLLENPPPNLAPFLPLEIAKARLDQALLEPDGRQRARRQAQARAELEALLKSHPNHPSAAEARLEIAGILVEQARRQLQRARRHETPASQRRGSLRARGQLQSAGQQIQAVTRELDLQLARYGDPLTPQMRFERQRLVQAKLQAELEQGINLVDQAQTYVEQSELLPRGEIIKKAAELFDKLAHRENANAVGALAQAWLMRCHQENGDPKAARRIYDTLLQQEGEPAQAAKRLAGFLLLRVIADDPLKNAAVEIRQAGENWLRNYRDYAHSPEGNGVCYELANAYVQLARRLYKQGAPPPTAQKLYDEALRLFRNLEGTENEYTSLARDQRLHLALNIAEERIRGDIHKLKTSEDCFLRAQAEASRLDKIEKGSSGPKVGEQRKKHLEDIITALQRGLHLADSSASAPDMIDAQYLLGKAYWLTGDSYRAAVLGEEVARFHQHSDRAPLASACALLAYAQLLAEQQRTGGTSEGLHTDRDRLNKLAQYVEQAWPDDTAADVARHQRGLLLWSAKKYSEAVEVLAQIHEDYADATHSLYLLALAAKRAHEAGVKPPGGQPAYPQRALAALERIPEPGAEVDTATLLAYLEAKLTLGAMLYNAHEHQRVQELAHTLARHVEAAAGMMDSKPLVEQRLRVLALCLLADYGQAEADYQAGRYGEACKRLDPILLRLQDPVQAGQFAEIKDPQLLRSVLALAVRAHVQQGNLSRGREVLELLQRSAPENAHEILVQLIQQLRAQMQELRQQGQAGKARLDKTIANFSAFLDELGKQHDKIPKPEMILFLAQSYSQLERHGRALELLERIAEPAAAATPQEVQLYRAARLLSVRELRLERKFDKAKEVLQSILGTPQRPGWGQQSLEAQKERILLLQDQEFYSGRAGAIFGWNELMAQLRPKIGQDNKYKEQYFECYYHLTYCVFKNALKMSDAKKQREALHLAANFIVQLEISQPDRGGELSRKLFEELLQQEPLLKAKYDELKKGMR